jgi:ParB-like chromosome segregation protein Spo0J
MWPLSRIEKELEVIHTEMRVYNKQLEEHMRRTELLEKAVSLQEKRLESLPQKTLTFLSIISALVVLGKALLM